MSDLTGNVFFEGPAGRLEAIIKEPATAATRVAIVCHPHPLFGGTMHNKVVFRIARAFQDAGFAVLRFNFRGTGRSEGSHDNGQGEQDDLQAALRYMEAKYPKTAVWLAGFSFGAAVMLRAACGYERACALVAAGTPVSRHDFSRVGPCTKPTLFVQGALDEFGSPEDLKRFVATLEGINQLKIIEGADHFFEGHLPEVFQAVTDFISFVEGEQQKRGDPETLR